MPASTQRITGLHLPSRGHLVEIGRPVEAGDRYLPDVADREVGVQRHLVRERGRATPRSGLPGSNVDFALVHSTASPSSDHDHTWAP